MIIPLGQESRCKIWEEMVESHKAPHGILVTGEKGIGKTVFVRFCLKKLGIDVNEKFSNNGDVFLVDRLINEKTGKLAALISIEQIRHLKSHFFETSLTSKFRCAIIENAEKLSTSASNALLKTLEEPPGGRFLFLITEFPYKLLSTVRSRLIEFSLKPADVNVVKKWAEQNFPDASAEDIEMALSFGHGMPGNVYKILNDEEELGFVKKMKKTYEDWSESQHARWTIMENIDKLCKTEDKIESWLDAWQTLALRNMSKRSLGTIRCVEKARLFLKSNVQRKLVLDQFTINSNL